jgi:hypothetical protein
MSIANWNKTAHSAEVLMRLLVNGHVLALGHLGPDYIILDDPIDHPPTEAEITVSVEGKESRWQVQLVDGLSASQARARIS